MHIRYFVLNIADEISVENYRHYESWYSLC